MRLYDIMTTPLLTARVDEPADAALARMRLRRVHHLAVMDRATIVGVLSARDLGRGTPRGTVGELMTRPVVTADKDTTVRQAANLMRGRGIGCLPVLDGNRVVGIVTISDLMELLGKGAEKPPRWVLKDRGPRRARHDARV
jgi:acetoin utilization protein AcuB